MLEASTLCYFSFNLISSINNKIILASLDKDRNLTPIDQTFFLVLLFAISFRKNNLSKLLWLISGTHNTSSAQPYCIDDWGCLYINLKIKSVHWNWLYIRSESQAKETLLKFLYVIPKKMISGDDIYAFFLGLSAPQRWYLASLHPFAWTNSGDLAWVTELVATAGWPRP